MTDDTDVCWEIFFYFGLLLFVLSVKISIYPNSGAFKSVKSNASFSKTTFCSTLFDAS